MEKSLSFFAVLALVSFVVFGMAWRAEITTKAFDQMRSSNDGPIVSTEAFHITKADGTKSIAQLIREQSTGSPTPDKVITSIHILVDAFNGGLVFAPGQPAGFQLGIAAGQDKKFNVTRISLKGIHALEFFPVKTDDRACNFLLILEFDPKS